MMQYIHIGYKGSIGYHLHAYVVHEILGSSNFFFIKLRLDEVFEVFLGVG